MTSEQWQRVKAIVVDARSRDPIARQEFIAAACGADDALRQEVTSLLEAVEGAAHRFEEPAFASSGGRSIVQAVLQRGDGSAMTDMVGRSVGPYQIQREIGRGGMAVVYLAARADREFDHQVALKIIKRGMDTDAIVRRFRTERQILAGLSHPHVARLLDGGTTADGLPYLVMEYVVGQPITAHCDARRLGVAARLRLFQQVCAAVAYAHQRLSSTATSSRRTFWSREPANRSCSTSGSRRSSIRMTASATRRPAFAG